MLLTGLLIQYGKMKGHLHIYPTSKKRVLYIRHHTTSSFTMSEKNISPTDNQNVQLNNRLSHINFLERNGAACIFENKPEKGLAFWRKAMDLRSDEPFIPKPVTTLSDAARIAFRDVREVGTIEELGKLSSKDLDSFHLIHSPCY